MRRFGLAQVSRLVEALAHLEEVRGEIWAAGIDGESLDHAPAGDDCASLLPEAAQLAGASLATTVNGEPERAGWGLDLIHVLSLGRRYRRGIGPRADLRAGFYGKGEGGFRRPPRASGVAPLNLLRPARAPVRRLVRVGSAGAPRRS